jgi:hypothetical protein
VASSALQEIYKADFLFATEFVYKGLWNYLEVLLCGTWWLGVGIFIQANRGLKITTVVLGISCIVDGVGELLQLPLMAEVGLNVYLVLAIVWPVWVGIAMLRNRF